MATGGRAAQSGGGRASDGRGRTSAQRRTASDGDRDEHGVAGASVAIIVTAPRLVVGDTVRAAQRCEPRSAGQLSERSLPAGVARGSGSHNPGYRCMASGARALGRRRTVPPAPAAGDEVEHPRAAPAPATPCSGARHLGAGAALGA